MPLTLNSKLHSERPDNPARVVLEGIQSPVSADIGFMSAFRHSLDDAEVAGLVA